MFQLRQKERDTGDDERLLKRNDFVMITSRLRNIL
jgi:hypothetical protein